MIIKRDDPSKEQNKENFGRIAGVGRQRADADGGTRERTESCERGCACATINTSRVTTRNEITVKAAEQTAAVGTGRHTRSEPDQACRSDPSSATAKKRPAYCDGRVRSGALLQDGGLG